MVTWNKWVMAGNKQDGTPLYYGEGYCLSTATKPTEGLCTGSVIIEIDTSTIYFFSEELKQWFPFGAEED